MSLCLVAMCGSGCERVPAGTRLRMSVAASWATECVCTCVREDARIRDCDSKGSFTLSARYLFEHLPKHPAFLELVFQ